MAGRDGVVTEAKFGRLVAKSSGRSGCGSMVVVWIVVVQQGEGTDWDACR